jgi:hydrogenase expression/formation protein HypC
MCLAIPARVVESTDDPSRTLVDVVGVRRHIDTGLLSENPPQAGDWVLVHVGFALSRISEEQALDQLRTLSMLGEQASAAEEASGYGMAEESPGDVFPSRNPGKEFM